MNMFLKNLGWWQLKRYLLIVIGLSLLACQNGEGKCQQSKGANKTMKTYPMGRFRIDVPLELKLAHQEHRIRYADIEEFIWPQNINKEQARNSVWEKKLTEIGNIKPLKGISNIVIEKNDFPAIGKWAHGILYYGDRLLKEEMYWNILVDAGQIGVWIKIHGISKNAMLLNLDKILKSYSLRNDADLKTPTTDCFYSEYGVFKLPYLEQEHTYARFEGHPLNFKLEIEMNETQEVEKTGLANKLEKLLVSYVTPGLDIHKIRSHKRAVAGLKGEEIAIKMTEAGESKLQFAWQYQGEEDSGEHPEIEITMESPDGNLDEKLKIWDAMLDSMKPMFVRKK